MAAKGGESRAGLVTFLVLFILLSIVLGVTTYYGYDSANTAQADAKKKEADAKAWNTDANYYKSLALTYRAYIGLPVAQKDDLPGLRRQYDSGSFNSARDENGKDEHKKTLTELWGEKTAKKWENGKPNETYLDEIKKVSDERDAEKKAKATAIEDAAKANAKAEATQREVEKLKADYLKEITDLKAKGEQQLAGLRTTVTQLQEELAKAGEKGPKDLDDLRKQITDVSNHNKKLTKDLGAALKTIKERGDAMAREAAAQEIDVSRIAPENLATIFSINKDGDMPYITVGSADNLKRQATFSIYGKGIDGKPLKEPKGKLEVVRITGAHTAQARITELRDERRDPVLPGDFIYNPAWNPNLKQHVAIIGTIDLTGEHRDSTQEFIRTLQRQGVEVDAYMDMRTKKLMSAGGDGPGEITRRTDLLIVGEGPDFGTAPIKGGDPKTDAKNDTVAAMQKYQDEAEKLGVRIVRLSTFLEMSGYPLPKPLGSERGKIGFQRNLDAAGSPVQRREPQK